jgi:hypothetical protein
MTGCSAWCKPRISIGGERPAGLPARWSVAGWAYINAECEAGRAVSSSQAPWQCMRPTDTSSWTKSDTASGGRHMHVLLPYEAFW